MIVTTRHQLIERLERPNLEGRHNRNSEISISDMIELVVNGKPYLDVTSEQLKSSFKQVSVEDSRLDPEGTEILFVFHDIVLEGMTLKVSYSTVKGFRCDVVDGDKIYEHVKMEGFDFEASTLMKLILLSVRLPELPIRIPKKIEYPRVLFPIDGLRGGCCFCCCFGRKKTKKKQQLTVQTDNSNTKFSVLPSPASYVSVQPSPTSRVSVQPSPISKGTTVDRSVKFESTLLDKIYSNWKGIFNREIVDQSDYAWPTVSDNSSATASSSLAPRSAPSPSSSTTASSSQSARIIPSPTSTASSSQSARIIPSPTSTASSSQSARSSVSASTTASSNDLLGKFQEFIKPTNAKRPLIVSDEFGVESRVACLQLSDFLWQNYQTYGVVPIVTLIEEVQNPSIIRDEFFRKLDLTSQEKTESKNLKYLFIFLERGTKRFNNLYNANKLVEKTIFATSLKGLVGDRAQDLASYSPPATHSFDEAKCEVVYIGKLTDAQLQLFKSNNFEKQHLFDFIEKVPALKELVKRRVFMSAALAVLPAFLTKDPTQQTVLHEICRKIVKKTVDLQIDELSRAGQSMPTTFKDTVMTGIQKVAVKMKQENLDRVKHTPVVEDFGFGFGGFEDDAENQNDVKDSHVQPVDDPLNFFDPTNLNAIFCSPFEQSMDGEYHLDPLLRDALAEVPVMVQQTPPQRTTTGSTIIDPGKKDI